MNSKVGIGTDSPTQRLHVDSGVSGDPATSGNTQPNGTFRLRGADNSVLDVGERAGATGTWWLQSTDKTDHSFNYPLVLNPRGGNVGIGMLGPSYKLDVSGSFRSTGKAVVNGATDMPVDGLDVRPGGRALRTDATPYFNLEREGTGGNGNQIGAVGAVALDSVSTRTEFSGIDFYSKDFNNGTETGEIRLRTLNNGGGGDRLSVVGDKVGIGTTSPRTKLEVKGADGNIWIEEAASGQEGGGLGFIRPSPITSASTVLYRTGGSNPDTRDVLILRNFVQGTETDPVYTLMKIWAPKQSSITTVPREATLALTREADDGQAEFLDIYNNYYSTEKQYGIRIGKNGNDAQFQDFVIDQWDSAPSVNKKYPMLALKKDRTLWHKSHGDATTPWSGSDSIQATAAKKTTDDTVQTLATIALDTPRAYHITVRVVGRKSDGTDFAFFNKVALAYRQGGNATMVTASGANPNPSDLGGTPILSSGANTGGWACTISAEAGTNNILVKVTGQASTTIYWVGTIEFQSVSTDA